MILQKISIKYSSIIFNKLPGGNGANDLAHPALMTSKLSEITREPSAALPQ